MKKAYRTLFIVGLLIVFCVGCTKHNNQPTCDDNEVFVFDSEQTYDLVYKKQLSFCYSYFEINEGEYTNYCLFKTTISNINHESYPCYLEINVQPEIVFYKEIYNKPINISEVKNIYLDLYDEHIYNECHGRRLLYMRLEDCSSFLENYDYFYFFLIPSLGIQPFDYKTNTRDDSVLNICIKTKRYNILPIRDGKLKLDELLSFYKKSSSLPYDYHLITEYGESINEKFNGRKFTDLFWNDMSEEELKNSFESIIDNPFNVEFERWEG